jgi:hypothetical protein
LIDFFQWCHFDYSKQNFTAQHNAFCQQAKCLSRRSKWRAERLSEAGDGRANIFWESFLTFVFGRKKVWLSFRNVSGYLNQNGQDSDRNHLPAISQARTDDNPDGMGAAFVF